jgi:membrane protein implicated in regulation of membrane protease activity
MPAPPESQETESPVITPTRVVIGLCLFVPFIAMLWVGSYARVEPTFIGLPFFYWYQMLWVPLSAVLAMTAYKLVKREDAKRRAQREGDAR